MAIYGEIDELRDEIIRRSEPQETTCQIYIEKEIYEVRRGYNQHGRLHRAIENTERQIGSLLHKSF